MADIVRSRSHERPGHAAFVYLGEPLTGWCDAHQLRVRERLNLRFRDVEEASTRIANVHSSDEYIVTLSRLADIENKGVMWISRSDLSLKCARA